MPNASPAPPAEIAAELRRHGHVGPGTRFDLLVGGRSNQVWRVRAATGDRVLKLYRPGDGNPLFANDPLREVLCLRALARTGLVPVLRASGSVKARHWLLYDFVAGSCWSADAAAVARVLAHVHRLPPPGGLPVGANGSIDLERQTVNILGQCSAPARTQLLALRPALRVPPLSDLRLIHGDPVPGNILTDRSATVLIDWQCPALGDPAEDLAVFLSPAMQTVYRGSVLDRRETETFLSAYPDTNTVDRYLSLRPWFHWRMAAYCLWQVERGVRDYAAGLALELGGLAPGQASAA